MSAHSSGLSGEERIHEPEKEDALRYWRMVIACLPTLEKREAAWEFALCRMSHAQGATDLLSGLVLLLEANGAFLEQLPARYHERLVLPLSSRIESLERRLATHEEHERETQILLEQISKTNLTATNRAIAFAESVEHSLKSAATAVDTQAVVQRVCKQLEEHALLPFAKRLEELAKNAKQVDQATTAAEAAIERCRRLYLGGAVSVIASTLLVVSTVAVVWACFALSKHSARNVAAKISGIEKNQEALATLTALGASLTLAPVPDANGKIDPTRMALLIDGAIDAGMDEGQNRKRGYVLFKSWTFPWRLEQLKREVQALERAAEEASALQVDEKSRSAGKQ